MVERGGNGGKRWEWWRDVGMVEKGENGGDWREVGMVEKGGNGVGGKDISRGARIAIGSD